MKLERKKIVKKKKLGKLSNYCGPVHPRRMSRPMMANCPFSF